MPLPSQRVLAELKGQPQEKSAAELAIENYRRQKTEEYRAKMAEQESVSTKAPRAVQLSGGEYTIERPPAAKAIQVSGGEYTIERPKAARPAVDEKKLHAAMKAVSGDKSPEQGNEPTRVADVVGYSQAETPDYRTASQIPDADYISQKSAKDIAPNYAPQRGHQSNYEEDPYGRVPSTKGEMQYAKYHPEAESVYRAREVAPGVTITPKDVNYQRPKSVSADRAREIDEETRKEWEAMQGVDSAYISGGGK
jgi:hypothetical protein